MTPKVEGKEKAKKIEVIEHWEYPEQWKTDKDLEKMVEWVKNPFCPGTYEMGKQTELLLYWKWK